MWKPIRLHSVVVGVLILGSGHLLSRYCYAIGCDVVVPHKTPFYQALQSALMAWERLEQLSSSKTKEHSAEQPYMILGMLMQSNWYLEMMNRQGPLVCYENMAYLHKLFETIERVCSQVLEKYQDDCLVCARDAAVLIRKRIAAMAACYDMIDS